MLEIPNNSSFSCSIKSIKDQKRWLMTACLHPCWFCERNEDKDSLPQNHIQPNIPVTCQLKFSLITYSHFTNFQIFQRVLCEKSFFYIDFDLKIINLTVHPILLTCLNIIEGGHKRWDVVSCDPQYISVANCKPHHIDFIQYIIQITQYCPNHITIFHYLRCLACRRLPSLHSYSSVFFKHGLWHDRNTRHIFGSLKCRSGRGVGCVSIVCKLSYRLFLRPTLTLSHIIFNVFQT